MKLHPKLEPYRSRKNIVKFSKLLGSVEGDLQCACFRDLEVELWEKEYPNNAIKRLLRFEDRMQPHQILIGSGDYRSRSFTVALPMRNARTMPYFVTIDLLVGIDPVAEYRSALIGGKLKITYGSKEALYLLSRFRMPKILFSHTAGGYDYYISTGSVLGPSSEDPEHATW